MPLTNAAVKAAKARVNPVKISDGGGLHLLVQPAGSKLWRLAYRFGGKQKQLALGAYPAVSLLEARKARDSAKEQLRKGLDPGHVRKLEKLGAAVLAENTFKVVAEEWFRKQEGEGRAEATLEKNRWLLDDLAYPYIGDRSIAEITPRELLVVLRKPEGRGNFEATRNLKSVCGRVFRFAVATGRAERDPTADLRGALTTPKTEHRPAITDPKGVGELLRAIDGYTGQPVTIAALRLLPLVFVRPIELRLMEWLEIDFDKAVWTIPGGRMKKRRAHLVPLAQQSIAILKDLQKIAGRAQLVFPGIRSSKRPISENTLNGALRRLGYGSEEVCSHGFRATASTLLNETGDWNPDAIERQLAHEEKSETRRSYARGQYWDERVAMMQAWADYLDKLRDQPSAKRAPMGGLAQ